MKLTVITINFNNRTGLERTCQSIANQSVKNFEWIIIDGGSTDGSLDIIKNYSVHISFWLSEPDKGIYNAMNKGVSHAHGTYCLFLNSGDYLYENDTIAKFNNKTKIDTEDFIIGNVMIDESNGNKFIWGGIPKITAYEFFSSSLPHPSTFIKTIILKERPYREDYRIVSDWVFFMENLLIHQSTYKRIDLTVSVFLTDGISSKNLDLCKSERERGFKEIFGEAIYNDYADFYKYKTRKLTKLERIASRMKQYPFFYYLLTFFGIMTELLSKPYKLLEKLWK